MGRGNGGQAGQAAAAGDADGGGEVQLGRGEMAEPVLADPELGHQHRQQCLVGVRQVRVPEQRRERVVGVPEGEVEWLQPEPRPHQPGRRGRGPAHGLLGRVQDPVQPPARALDVVDRPALEGHDEPGAGMPLDHLAVTPRERRDTRALVPEHHPQPFEGEHVRGQVGLADGEQPVEREPGVPGGEVQAHRPGHGGPGLDHVDAAAREPAADDLGQQRVDAVQRAVRPARLPGLVVAEAGDQKAGGLQVGQHLGGAGVVGQPYRGQRIDHRLGGRAQQQVPLPGMQCREDLAGHAVGHGRLLPGVPGGGRDRVRRGTDGARGEHDGRAPALGVRRDRPQHFGRRRPGVLDDQCGCFFVVHPEHAAAQDREVPAQLRDQAVEAEVPAAQQQQPQALGVGVEPLVDGADGGQRQLVGVVDHDEPRGGSVPVGCGTRVQDGGQPVGGPLAVRVQPDHAAVLLTAPAYPTAHPERLAGARGSDEQGHGAVGGPVETIEEPLPGHVGARQPRRGAAGAAGPAGLGGCRAALAGLARPLARHERPSRSGRAGSLVPYHPEAAGHPGRGACRDPVPRHPSRGVSSG